NAVPGPSGRERAAPASAAPAERQRCGGAWQRAADGPPFRPRLAVRRGAEVSFMLVHGTRRALAALTGAVLLVCAGRAGASRCGTALISGGLKAECPSVDDARLPACPPGTTRVVYRLDRPFPPDGSTSMAVIHSTPNSPCAGA